MRSVFLCRGGLLVAAALGMAACAAISGPTLSREQVQTMLNTELNTGDSSDAIKSFFERHDFPYTYDSSLRRYASSVPPGSRAPLAIYIYTDVDQKLTVTQVVAPPAPPRPQRRANSADALDGILDPNRPRRPF